MNSTKRISIKNDATYLYTSDEEPFMSSEHHEFKHNGEVVLECWTTTYDETLEIEFDKNKIRARCVNFHRDDGHAVIWPQSNIEEWWRYGKRHRKDGPAISSHEKIYWYLDGNLHREDGPAVVQHNFTDNTITHEWWQFDRRHNDDGPAIRIFAGTKQALWPPGAEIEEQLMMEKWYHDSMLHRDDGPAIVDHTAGRYTWAYLDRTYDFTEWFKTIKVSDEEKTLLKLKYGGVT